MYCILKAQTLGKKCGATYKEIRQTHETTNE